VAQVRPEDLEAMVAEIDKSGDGNVDFQEFLQVGTVMRF
jgi:centrin-1